MGQHPENVVSLEEIRARKTQKAANDIAKLKCILLNKKLLEDATHVLNFLEDSGFIRFRWVNSDYEILENGTAKIYVRAEIFVPYKGED